MKSDKTNLQYRYKKKWKCKLKYRILSLKVSERNSSIFGNLAERILN